jgi:hypothetical protein
LIGALVAAAGRGNILQSHCSRGEDLGGSIIGPSPEFAGIPRSVGRRVRGADSD